jgi:hypothetical protein
MFKVMIKATKLSKTVMFALCLGAQDVCLLIKSKWFLLISIAFPFQVLHVCFIQCFCMIVSPTNMVLSEFNQLTPYGEVKQHALVICYMPTEEYICCYVSLQNNIYAHYSLLWTFYTMSQLLQITFLLEKVVVSRRCLKSMRWENPNEMFSYYYMFASQQCCLLWCPTYQPMKPINSNCVAMQVSHAKLIQDGALEMEDLIWYTTICYRSLPKTSTIAEIKWKLL